MPATERLKSRRVPVYLTAEQKLMLARIADLEGEHLAATVRMLLREGAERRGLVPTVGQEAK
ncbi:MAG TPA: hypothetical protein PLY56_05520 [Armatimonadota bacterium]|nr:hypothetical protein [Armatimonadota bacterium]HOM83520.1 hypothetical protein [Armatimonadota bacterium]HPO74526.1 hypothetical protein [Armatimonadota bacterium]